MKSILPFFLLCSIILTTNAKEQYGTVKGKVLDKDNNQPLPFANVTLIDKSGILISGATTDFDGEYEISQIPIGNYRYQVTYAGYKTLMEDSINILKDSTIHKIAKLTLLTNTINSIVMPYICFTNKNKQTIQKSYGSISGMVVDRDSYQPLPFANIILELDGKMTAKTITDFDGKYEFDSISKGNYSLKITYTGYKTITTPTFHVSSNDSAVNEFTMETHKIKYDPHISHHPPLIDKWNISSGYTFRSSDIQKMPTR